MTDVKKVDQKGKRKMEDREYDVDVNYYLIHLLIMWCVYDHLMSLFQLFYFGKKNSLLHYYDKKSKVKN